MPKHGSDSFFLPYSNSENALVTDKWEGKTVIDGDAATLCRPGEWLLVEAWDES